MSRENIEIVRRLLDAHEKQDFETVYAIYDPQIVWRIGRIEQLTSVGIEPTYVGHDGVRTFWREWLNAWETVSFEYEEFIDAGDRVIVVLSQRMRGRASGAEVDMRSYVQMWTVRDGRIVEMELFESREKALRAVGLEE